MKKLAWLLAVILSGTLGVSADVLFSDNFEDGTITNWTTVTGNISNQDLGGNRVAQLAHVSGVRETFGNSGTANSGADHAQLYVSADIKLLTGAVDADFTLGTSNFGGAAARVLLLDLDSATATRDTFETFELFVNNTAGAMSYLQYGLSGTTAANTADLYINDVLVQDDVALSANLNANIKSYGFIINKSVGATTMQLDNVSVESVIPEPGTIGLFGFAATGLFWFRRKFNI